MSENRPGARTRYIHWAQRPRVCAIVDDGSVVTVITHELIRASPRHLRLLPSPGGRVRPAAERRWRWDGSLEPPGGEVGEEKAA